MYREIDWKTIFMRYIHITFHIYGRKKKDYSVSVIHNQPGIYLFRNRSFGSFFFNSFYGIYTWNFVFTIGCTIVNHDVTCGNISHFCTPKIEDNSLCDRLYGQLQYIVWIHYFIVFLCKSKLSKVCKSLMEQILFAEVMENIGYNEWIWNLQCCNNIAG